MIDNDRDDKENRLQIIVDVWDPQDDADED